MNPAAQGCQTEALTRPPSGNPVPDQGVIAGDSR
jgi:hypothetical protein